MGHRCPERRVKGVDGVWRGRVDRTPDRERRPMNLRQHRDRQGKLGRPLFAAERRTHGASPHIVGVTADGYSPES